MRYDTTALIAAVVRMAKIPSGSTYRDADTLLAIANDEMAQWVVPSLLEVSGGHLMAYEDTALVSGQSRYRFPARAIRPERLVLVDSDGKRVGKLHLASGDMVDKVLAGAEGTTAVDNGAFGEAHGFWVPENNHAVVVLQTGVDSTGRSLRIYYRRAPNQLVAVNGTSGGTIVSLTDLGDNISYLVQFSSEANASAFADATANLSVFGIGKVDLVRAAVPVETLAQDLEPLGGGVEPTPTQVAVVLAENSLRAGGLPVVGDYIMVAGTTPAPQVPVSFWGVLTAHVTAGVLLEMGEQAKSQQWRDIAVAKLEKVMATASPRSEEAETAAQDAWD